MFFFTNKRGERIEFAKGIVPLHTNIASPSINTIVEYTDLGYPVILDRHIEHRQIQVEIFLEAYDFDDHYLLRDKLYEQLSQEEELYFHESRLPYKRWRVIIQGDIIPTKGYRNSHYTMTFLAINGYSESIASTLNKHEFSEDVWQFGMGLTFEPQQYIFDKPRFEVENLGNIKIDPRTMPLVIEFIGASNNLEIHNRTTGDIWKYNGTTTATQKITLNGINSYKSGTNILKDTNKQLITLDSGFNEFEIKGATGKMMITFDHKFYYY